jgi:hypothetical protein
LYYIDLHPYSHYCFSKIWRPFCASRDWWIIVVFLQCNCLTIMIVSQKYWELLQRYSHDRFSKISRTICASRNYWIIVLFFQDTLKEKLPIFLINTLSLHIPLLSLTDGQNDRVTNTLGERGLEELFSSCAVVSVFWFLAGNNFRCYLPTIPVVPLCLFFVAVGNSFGLHRLFFLLWQEIVLGVTYLPTIQVVSLCS